MRNRQSSRNHDTSPYGNNSVHLIPPMENNWHRSISDSAIHQSLCQQNQVIIYRMLRLIQTPNHNIMLLSFKLQLESNHLNTHSPLTLSPTVQRKISNAQSINKVHHHISSNHLENSVHDIRSRSSTCVARLPGIKYGPKTPIQTENSHSHVTPSCISAFIPHKTTQTPFKSPSQVIRVRCRI